MNPSPAQPDAPFPEIRRATRRLVVLQTTPFCNINCGYCYLPHRQSTAHMSPDVYEAVFEQVLGSPLFTEPLSFLWHAGEPLSVPKKLYRDAFEVAQRLNQRYQRKYVQAIQTNGTLIDEGWVELFREHRVNVGLSIDGPEFIHDRVRVTRGGEGTHARTVRGLRLLQGAGMHPAVIMVLTRFALDYPDEVFEFFRDAGVRYVGFNIDEQEGINPTSSHANTSDEAYRRFMGRFLERVAGDPSNLYVREFADVVATVLNTGDEFRPVMNATNDPMSVVTVDHQGNYSTFCPELSGATSERFNNFVMGNVLTDPLDRLPDRPVFQRVNAEVRAGVRKCEAECAYWSFCGGGSPSNKFFEHGRFDVTETLLCRLHKKVLVDVVLEHLERKPAALAPRPEPSGAVW